MNPVYVYGGYILTSGTFEGRTWQGVNIMLAEVKPTNNGGYTAPVVAYAYKASRTDSIMDVLKSLVPSESFVHAYFSAPDAKGRVKIVMLDEVS